MAVPKLRTGSYFPDHHSNIRLVGTVPTEQTDERTEVKAAVTSAWRPSNSAVDASEDSVLGTHNCLHSRVISLCIGSYCRFGLCTFPHQDVSAQRRHISFLIRFVDTSGVRGK